MTFQRAAFLGFGLLASIAWAEPAIVYDMGGKFDKSFNEAAYNGAERWKKETGKAYLDFEIANARLIDLTARCTSASTSANTTPTWTCGTKRTCRPCGNWPPLPTCSPPPTARQ